MRTPHRLIATMTTAVVVLLIAASFTVMGSPAEQRRRRLDDVRVTHMKRLSEAIDRCYGRHQRLPASLEETERDQGESAALRDPVSQARYEYRLDGPRAYSLCAHLDRPAPHRRHAGPLVAWRWPAVLRAGGRGIEPRVTDAELMAARALTTHQGCGTGTVVIAGEVVR